MSWHGRLSLHYRRDGGRTTAHDRHDGPLRVLQRLYPEGEAICHHVLVHPPGGMVGGDRLDIDATLDAGTHALITTPGASRYYRSDGAVAVQDAVLRVGADARLEWLPLETIAYPGCVGAGSVRFAMDDGAQAIGWDLLALGLPAAGAPFATGRYTQHVEVEGQWIDRGTIDAGDRLLLDGPVGLAGHRVVATMWWCAGGTVAPALRSALVDAARDAVDAGPLRRSGGVTAVQPAVVVVRLLADGVEPAMATLAAVRAAWRHVAWGLDAEPPRTWRL